VHTSNAAIPTFPQFKVIEIGDRAFLQERLRAYRPVTSELTFTNLFIWRNHYGFQWTTHGDCLLIVGANPAHGIQALPPIGPGARNEVTIVLIDWLRKVAGIEKPQVDRADQRLVSELEGDSRFLIQSARDHFDYVYQVQDLTELAGKNYRAKRNHMNFLLRTHRVEYRPMEESDIDACLELADGWCEARDCEEDLSLSSEADATREALKNFSNLGIDGGVVVVNGCIEAFALGELLNSETAVVHIEKANTDIRGLYAVVNQQFCEQRWRKVPFINREQDLGEDGLRTAKLSYNPHHLVEKYSITLKG
jgi:uncharacterized protein